MRKFFTLFVWLGLFFPLAMSAMIMTSMRPWILDRSFYERIVNDDRISDRLFSEELPNQFNLQVFGAADQLPLNALNTALSEVITPDYIHKQSAHIVNEMVDFVKGSNQPFDFSMDLTSIKVALRGEAGLRFANTLASALPVCESYQTPVASAGKLSRCIGSNLSVAQTAAQIAHALPAVLENTPDHILLNNTLDLQRDLQPLDWFLEITVRTGLDMAIVMVILLICLVGVALGYMGGSDARISLRRLTASLLIPASLFLLVGIGLDNSFIAEPIRNALHFSGWSGLQAGNVFGQALGDMSIIIVRHVGSSFLLIGCVTCLIVLVVFIFSPPSPANVRQTVEMEMMQVSAQN